MGRVIRSWKSLLQESEEQLPQPHHLFLSAHISSLDWQAQALPLMTNRKMSC